MVEFTRRAAQTAPMRIIPSEMRQIIPTTRTKAPSLAERLMQMPSRTLSSAQSAPMRIIPSEMRQTISTTRTKAPSLAERLVQMPSRTLPTNILSPARIPAAMGGAARTLPTGRSVVSPVVGDRTGIVPPSTLSTQGAFGGESGGMGAAAAAPTALGPESLSGVESSIGKIGTDVMNTVTSLVPLAIKVILAIIVIKIVIWLLRGRR